MLLKWIETIFKVSRSCCHMVVVTYVIDLWWGFMGIGLFWLVLSLILVNTYFPIFKKKNVNIELLIILLKSVKYGYKFPAVNY